MQCKKCNRQSEIELKYLEPLCSKCFCEVIEKRIRKYTRLNKAFRKNDRLLITDELCLFLVKRIIGGLPVKIFFKEYSVKEVLKSSPELEEYMTPNKINKIVIPWTLDDDACLFLYNVFNNNHSFDLTPHSIVFPLKKITNKEAELCASFNKITFKPNDLFPSAKILLDSLDNLYPDTKFGLVKTKEMISKLQ